ncbi:helix-turn-helix transcriptional regulator [Methanobrevibacter sp.]|uniref:helix-turn-helix transcriptional regulator n=1 Tax=Methanobrevibacter sp. TaxID=66852 RepID=UPI003868272C
MKDSKIYLENYESISQEVKYLTKSLIRLKILAILYEKPLAMKDLNEGTGLSYSSISSNMHFLELRGHVYRYKNKYHLSNSTKLKIEEIIELGSIIKLLNEFFNILDKHLVDMIPNQSVAELYLLGKANLIESDGIDVYKMYNYIEEVLTNANEVKCILPFYHENFNDKLNDLVDNRKRVEAVVPEVVIEIFEEKSKIKRLFTFTGEHNFLLIITDEVMILGLFKDDGYFDQNRLLTSKNEDSIKWAENLFKNFKKENK